MKAPAPDLASRLLAWYDHHRRRLPWRAEPGARPDPYRVWLSEVMLQQTTVATAGPYFERFVRRWPTLAELARAPLDEVLHAWQGLGYYARARNLHRCARELERRPDGGLPEAESELRALPGIGPYSAAAIAAIAFGRPAVVVDGNVERVMARLHGIDQPLPESKPRLRALAAALTPAARPGDYAQAVMDLGALVCTPRRPRCESCPWARACVARARGNPQSLPRRAPKAERPTRHGVAFWAALADGRALFLRRPEEGLLGGMMEVPSTPWRERPWGPREARRRAPLAAEWRQLEGVVRHTFSHFRLELAVLSARAPDEGAAEGAAEGADEGAGSVWQPLERLDELALPSVMKKVVRHARGSGAT